MEEGRKNLARVSFHFELKFGLFKSVFVSLNNEVSGLIEKGSGAFHTFL